MQEIKFTVTDEEFKQIEDFAYQYGYDWYIQYCKDSVLNVIIQGLHECIYKRVKQSKEKESEQ
jgi:hypothetical protein